MSTELKKYFTDTETAADIIATLENGYTGYYCDLHNEVFNTTNYINGNYESERALVQYGVFDAIEEIKEYEQENFDEVFTDFTDPVKVANMLFYLKGNEFLYDTFEFYSVLEEAIEVLALDETDLWNSEATEQVNNYIIKELTYYLN